MNIKQLDTSKVYLITGAAGFIGYFLAKKLLAQGCRVIGVDQINDYYNVSLKYNRLEQLQAYAKFTFVKADISDKRIHSVFEKYKPQIVINLAAQAGVRYSIQNPDVYIQSNIVGFFHILEACRNHPVDHLVYASSSSVYGTNEKVPFEETDAVDNQVSLYATTKKTNELMANSYSHLYQIPSTGLRFFTVYGPMGRPDMAYHSFADKYFADEPIHIYNNGDADNDLYRDFTYIDDIIVGIERLLPNPPVGLLPHKIYNIGNNKPVKLMVFIETLEKAFSKTLGRRVDFHKIFKPRQPGDVPATYASTALLEKEIGFKPETSIEEGLERFAAWYVDYYGIKKL
ncbi:GDP-mannose 4,6-dehydratase [Paenibacillus lignilyticus]|uniref:GDP-mannose 4,6-dehydratase n=1 Tax=Paenibacillus lignilyticus TaxID=1172615 RepID=A0ABS5CG40_9BACL|nr:GDP-mannose 4,6-dehydratase [Paenibacillus lignilyticus]